MTLPPNQAKTPTAILKTVIYRLISIQIVNITSEMGSSHQNKNFDVLQAILHREIVIFHSLPDAAGSVDFGGHFGQQSNNCRNSP